MANIKEALMSLIPRPSFTAGMPNDLVVCLENFPPQPETSVERFTIAVLTQRGAMPLYRLVECVAYELYREEIRNGATTLDIGLFGSRLFVPDVIAALKARNG